MGLLAHGHNDYQFFVWNDVVKDAPIADPQFPGGKVIFFQFLPLSRWFPWLMSKLDTNGFNNYFLITLAQGFQVVTSIRGEFNVKRHRYSPQNSRFRIFPASWLPLF